MVNSDNSHFRMNTPLNEHEFLIANKYQLNFWIHRYRLFILLVMIYYFIDLLLSGMNLQYWMRIKEDKTKLNLNIQNLG